jgi:hypothetical protein
MSDLNILKRKSYKTVLIYFLGAVYIILMIYHSFLFYEGDSSIITTFLFYISLFLISAGVIGVLSRFFQFFRQRKKEFLLVFATLFCSLFMVELYLKYINGTYKGYPEKNGEFYFHSYYRQINQQNWLYFIGNRKEKPWYWWQSPGIRYDIRKTEFCYEHRINSAGARDREFTVNKLPGEYRIITIGDSYTEGIGTAQDSTYPRFLERDLRQHYPERKISVYNCGASGSDPVYEYILLKDKLLKYSPDLVIMAVNSTDIQDVWVRGGMERFNKDGTTSYRTPPVWEPIYCLSYICRHIVHDLYGYNWMFIKEKDMRPTLLRCMADIRNSIERVSELSEKYNFRLLLILHPSQYEVGAGMFPIGRLSSLLVNNKNIEILSLFDRFANSEKTGGSAPNTYFWQIDGHNTAKGYEFFASGAANKIIGMKWINDQTSSE